MEKIVLIAVFYILPLLSLLLLITIIILLVFVIKYESENRRLKAKLALNEDKERLNNILNECRVSSLKKFGVKDKHILNTKIDYSDKLRFL